MKNLLPLSFFCLTIITPTFAQNHLLTEKQKMEISSLIDKYSEAREKRDTVLLKSILTPDVDQLVSSGEWRTGVMESVKGMMKSSQNSPGTRTLKVEKIRRLDTKFAVVDARYEIQNADGSGRKMWSTFVVAYDKNAWKISAIRNMLPAAQ